MNQGYNPFPVDFIPLKILCKYHASILKIENAYIVPKANCHRCNPV